MKDSVDKQVVPSCSSALHQLLFDQISVNTSFDQSERKNEQMNEKVTESYNILNDSKLKDFPP